MSIQKSNKIDIYKEGLSFGELIDELMSVFNLNQVQFAEKMGIDRSQVSRWIAQEGQDYSPRRKTIKKIQQVFEAEIKAENDSSYTLKIKGVQKTPYVANDKVSQIREKINEYQSQVDALEARKFPENPPLELLRSAMRLIDVAIKELQAQQQNKDYHQPRDSPPASESDENKDYS